MNIAQYLEDKGKDAIKKRVGFTRLKRLTNKIQRLEDSKSKYEKKISNVKNNIIYMGNRKRDLRTFTKKVHNIDAQIDVVEDEVALTKDNDVRRKMSNYIRRKVGAKQIISEMSKRDHDKEKSDKKKENSTTKKSTSKEKSTVEELEDVGLAPKDKKLKKDSKKAIKKDKESLKGASEKQIKKLVFIDKAILKEIKKIRENQVDEQDTTIKKKTINGLRGKSIIGKVMRPAKVTTQGAAIAAGLLLAGFGFKNLSDALDMPEGTEEERDDKQHAINKAKTESKVGLTAIKASSMASSKVASKVGQPLVKVAKKKMAKKTAEALVKGTLKKSGKPFVKGAVGKAAPILVRKKISKLAFKRLARETDDQLTKRITKVITTKLLKKTLGKKIPIAGIAVTIASVGMRIAIGEYGKAAVELASGIAAIFPGVGTAVSFAIDAALIVSDVADIFEGIKQQETHEEQRKSKKEQDIQAIMRRKRSEKVDVKINSTLAKDKDFQALKTRSNSASAELQKFVKDGGDIKSDEGKKLKEQMITLRTAEVKMQKEISEMVKNANTKKFIKAQALAKVLAEHDGEISKAKKMAKNSKSEYDKYVKEHGVDDTDAYKKLKKSMITSRQSLVTMNSNIDKEVTNTVILQADEKLRKEAEDEYNGVKSLDTGRRTSNSPLLDRISLGEGTYKTGYNTTFSYGKYDPTNKPITDMTLGEIRKFQAGMLANGAKSTAVGRYQFIRATFNDVSRGMGLPDDTVFNAKTQDDMIMYRLKRTRGYDSWRAGKISDDKFQHKLSLEFASVEDPYIHRSHYNQRVGTNTAQMKLALQAEKNGQGASTSDGVMVASGGGPTVSNARVPSVSSASSAINGANNQGGTSGGSQRVAIKGEGTEAVMGTARAYMGTKYVWGGKGSSSGLDCSGFVQNVITKTYPLKAGGNGSQQDKFPGSTETQLTYMKNFGSMISYNSAQAGDVVFFKFGHAKGRNVDHVGLYTSSDTFIESAHSKGGVVERKMPKGYYKHIVGVGRLDGSGIKNPGEVSTPASIATGTTAVNKGKGNDMGGSVESATNNLLADSKADLKGIYKDLKTPTVDKTGRESVIDTMSTKLASLKGAYDTKGMGGMETQLASGVSDMASSNNIINTAKEDGLKIMDSFTKSIFKV